METYLHVAAELHIDSGIEVEWSIMKGLQHGKEIALINVYNAALEDDYEKNDDSIPITCFEDDDDDDDETSNESSEIERSSDDYWDGAGRQQKIVEKKKSCEIIDKAADFFVGKLVQQTAVEICGCSNQFSDRQSVAKEDTKNVSTEESDIFSNVHPANEDNNDHPIIDDDRFMRDILRAIAMEQEKVARRNKGKEEKLSIVVTYTPRDAKQSKRRQ